VVAVVVAVSMFLTSVAAAAKHDVVAWHHEKGQTHFAFLDIPFFTLIELERSQDESDSTFFQLPFLTIFHNRVEAGHPSLAIFDNPILTIFRSHNTPKLSDQKLIILPVLGALYSHHREPEGSETRVLFLIKFRRGEKKAPASESKPESKPAPKET
jgi:hypothetical protein